MEYTLRPSIPPQLDILLLSPPTFHGYFLGNKPVYLIEQSFGLDIFILSLMGAELGTRLFPFASALSASTGVLYNILFGRGLPDVFWVCLRTIASSLDSAKRKC